MTIKYIWKNDERVKERKDIYEESDKKNISEINYENMIK